MERDTMIKWEALIERHIKGLSDGFVWWIRLNKEKKVIALYRIGKKTEKFVPQDGIEETELGMKLRAEILEEADCFAKKISSSEQSKIHKSL